MGVTEHANSDAQKVTSIKAFRIPRVAVRACWCIAISPLQADSAPVQSFLKETAVFVPESGPRPVAALLQPARHGRKAAVKITEQCKYFVLLRTFRRLAAFVSDIWSYRLFISFASFVPISGRKL